MKETINNRLIRISSSKSIFPYNKRRGPKTRNSFQSNLKSTINPSQERISSKAILIAK